jgi:hypothetical protein
MRPKRVGYYMPYLIPKFPQNNPPFVPSSSKKMLSVFIAEQLEAISMVFCALKSSHIE